MPSSWVDGLAAPPPLAAMIAAGSKPSWSAPGAAALPRASRPDSANSVA